MTSTIPENNITAALTGSKYTENLTSTSPENNITAALTGSNNTENLTCTSLENNLRAALKCSRKRTVDEVNFTNLYFEKIFAKSLCRKQLPLATPMCSPLVSCVFRRFPAAPLQLGSPACMKIHFPGLYRGNTHSLWPSKTTFPNKSWPERHLEWDEQWHPVCKSRAGPENSMKKLARQKADIGLHTHPIVWRRSTTKGSERLRQKNPSGKMKEIYLGIQKNVGVNTMEIAALNKREPVGEGLELVRGTKESQSKIKETAAQNKTEPTEMAWN